MKSGVVSVIQQLDNKVSDRLIKAIKEKDLDYQTASPHAYQLNPAEEQYKRSKIISLAIYTDVTKIFQYMHEVK